MHRSVGSIVPGLLAVGLIGLVARCTTSDSTSPPPGNALAFGALSVSRAKSGSGGRGRG